MNQKNQNSLDELIYIEQQVSRTERQTLEGFDPKHRNIVDYIIGITYDIWENKGIGEIYHTYADDVLMHLGIASYSGIGRVIGSTLDALQAFPDRIPFGEEVIWSRAKGNKFFSSHRLGSTATHLGAHESYGAATGKKIFFHTVADCTIANNKIEEEWLIRDNYHILTQLGLDPFAMAGQASAYEAPIRDRRTVRSENAIPQYDIRQFDASCYSGDPSVKLVLSLFKEVFCDNFFNHLNDFYAPTAMVHSICERKYGGIPQIRDYLITFFAALPQAQICLDRITCNTGATDKVAVRWTISGEHRHQGLFGPPSGKMIYVVGVTHFVISEGKIQQQWDVFDLFDVLCQIYAQNFLGLQGSSSRFEGLQRTDSQFAGRLVQQNISAQTNKKTALAYVEAMGQNQASALPQLMAEYLQFNASRPFCETEGIAAFYSEFWEPLHRSFPDITDQPYIVMGGEANGNECVSMAGNFIGTFEREWLGIPPSRQCVWLRYQSHMQFQNGKIIKIWYLIDILDVMRQAGYDLFPSRGASVLVPPPLNGIITEPVAAEESEQTLQLVSDMLGALLRYDGKDYKSMGDLSKYWYEKDMFWYGPSGIGSTKGLAGFQTYHQFPFLCAFPNRGISARAQNDDSASYAEGNYACDFGFPSMYGTHSGSGWLGLDATGKKCTMRVMDFWRREGTRLKENWVMIDLIDIMEQLGTDVFALLREAQTKR